MTPYPQRIRMYLELQRRMLKGFVLRGNTFPIRKQLTEAGGEWNYNAKCWLMPSLESIERFGGVYEESVDCYVIPYPTPGDRRNGKDKFNSDS